MTSAPAGLCLALLVSLSTAQEGQDAIQRARALIDDRRPAEAVEILKPLTAPESTNGPAFLALGDAHRALRRFGEALAAYRRAGELMPDALDPVAGQAAMHSRLRQFSDAERKFRQVLEARPADHETRVGLAWTLSLQRKLDEALAEVEKVLAAAPDHADARIRLGWIRLWRHERDEAVRVFEKVLAGRPGDVEAGLGLVAAEQARGRTYVASQIAETLLRLHPDNGDVLMAVARTRVRLQRWAEAEEAARKVAQLDRGHVESLLLLGEVAMHQGRFADAEANYRRALEAEPEDVGARTGLATALRRQGRREEAKGVYRSVLQGDPDHVASRIGLGWEFIWEGLYADAEPEFNRVLARDSRNTEALAGLARLRQLQGRWSESQELYERALATDPWDEPALEGNTQVRKLRESRVRFTATHGEEFERDQVNELETIRLVTDAFTATWRKRISPETALEADARLVLTREINRVSGTDNYDIRHLAAAIGVRHAVADHWTAGGRVGAGRLDDSGSEGTWSFESGETFVEGSAWVSGAWSDNTVTVSWARTPLVIKDFPSFDLDVLAVDTVAAAYDSWWWKDGLTPSWHENRAEVTLEYAAYSDDNRRWNVDAVFNHRWVYDNGWKAGPLVRFRYASFDEDVAFYYSYDHQARMTIGARVDYEPPGAWTFGARYQATRYVTDERVNPGSHLFDPTLPIDTTEKTVTVGGHAIDARLAWQPNDSTRAGADAWYSWDNDHYITWSAGLFLEVGF